MEVTIRDLVSFTSPHPDLKQGERERSPYQALLESGIPGQVQMRLVLLNKKIGPAVESFWETRRDILQVHGEEQEDGTVKLAPDKMGIVNQQIRRMGEMTVSLPDNLRISAEEIRDISLPGPALDLALFLFDLEDESPVTIPDFETVLDLDEDLVPVEDVEEVIDGDPS